MDTSLEIPTVQIGLLTQMKFTNIETLIFNGISDMNRNRLDYTTILVEMSKLHIYQYEYSDSGDDIFPHILEFWMEGTYTYLLSVAVNGEHATFEGVGKRDIF